MFQRWPLLEKHSQENEIKELPVRYAEPLSLSIPQAIHATTVARTLLGPEPPQNPLARLIVDSTETYYKPPSRAAAVARMQIARKNSIRKLFADRIALPDRNPNSVTKTEMIA